MRNNRLHRSTCEGYTHTDTAQKLVSIYEAKGYQARQSGDEAKAHIYFQYADHWKRMAYSS